MILGEGGDDESDQQRDSDGQRHEVDDPGRSDNDGFVVSWYYQLYLI